MSENDAQILRQACRANAVDLVEESDLLARHERHARAFALAYFAAEEATKALLLVAVQAIIGRGGNIDWRDFWTYWHDHDPKSEAGILFGSHLPEGLDQLVALITPLFDQGMPPDSVRAKAEKLRLAREAAIYVDWDQRLHAPSARIAGAAEMLGLAKKLVALGDEFAGIFTSAEVMDAWIAAIDAASTGGIQGLTERLVEMDPRASS